MRVTAAALQRSDARRSRCFIMISGVLVLSSALVVCGMCARASGGLRAPHTPPPPVRLAVCNLFATDSVCVPASSVSKASTAAAVTLAVICSVIVHNPYTHTIYYCARSSARALISRASSPGRARALIRGAHAHTHITPPCSPITSIMSHIRPSIHPLRIARAI